MDILNEYKKYEEFLLMLSQPERSKSMASGDTQAKNVGKRRDKIKKTSTRVIRELSSSRGISSRNKSSRQSNKTYVRNITLTAQLSAGFL